jgi:SpoVK/Ycf46/Vps4 family AAA+-type ATPase
MPSSPSNAPLSAQEAKERLREIVEAFFFRRRRDQEQPPARRLLVRSPPGLGKTSEAIHWAICYAANRPRTAGRSAQEHRNPTKFQTAV